MAQAGVTANRGDPVSGEIRVPKISQCSGTLGNSFLGKLTGSVRQADQYACAACASIKRKPAMLSAAGSLFLNRAIVSAVEESRSLCQWGHRERGTPRPCPPRGCPKVSVDYCFHSSRTLVLSSTAANRMWLFRTVTSKPNAEPTTGSIWNWPTK